jgi:hypothetical protein
MRRPPRDFSSGFAISLLIPPHRRMGAVRQARPLVPKPKLGDPRNERMAFSSYFGVSFTSLLVSGVSLVTVPDPLSVST